MSYKFASVEEIRSATECVRANEAVRLLNKAERLDGETTEQLARLCPAGGPVALCEKDGLAWVVNGDSHSIAFASTGRGKTRRHVYPLVLTDILSGTNIVVNDMKGEIFDTFKDLLTLMDYTVYVVNLRQPSESLNRYNPLAIAWDEYHGGNEDAAFLYLRNFALSLFHQMAKTTNDAFWPNTAVDYFLSLTLGMLEAGVTKSAFTLESVASMDRWGNQNVTPSATFLAEFFRRLSSCNSVAAQFACGTIDAPNDTRASILSVFRNPLSLYVGQKGLMEVLSRDDFSIRELSKEKRAVFVVSPDESHSLGPVVVGILNQIMTALISYAHTDFDGVLPCRVDFILDEFGNLPSQIPDMEALVSASRSRNIRFHFVLQSVSQLSNVYGEEIKDVILDNIDNWFFMGSRGLQFIKHISELAGEAPTESGKMEPVMSVAKLQHLETRSAETEAFIMMGSLKPFVSALKDFGQYEKPKAVYVRPNVIQRDTVRKIFDVRKAARKMSEESLKRALKESMEGSGAKA